MTSDGGRILVLDDDPELRSMLARFLGERGFEVETAAQSVAIERLLGQRGFDVLVLDLMLGQENGLEVCARLRAQGETIPILMLTARGDPVDRIVGLEMGADDYLAKPFNPRELAARLQAMVRRQRLNAGPAAPQQPGYRFGPFELDIGARTLMRAGEVVALSTGEFALLQTLVAHPHRALGRERLLELAFGRGHEVTLRSIDVQIMRLRKAIEDNPSEPRYIQTVWGKGYQFCPGWRE